MNPGDTVGSYRVLEHLGSGAFGHVYKAEHTVTRRIDALKIVSSPNGSDSDAWQRFRREIEVHARLAHPNIAAVHHAFREGEHMVMAMEFVEGQSLAQCMAAENIPLRKACEYAIQILSALRFAHNHGIVHRDVKPDNIIITPDGIAKLADFGVARAPDDIRLTQAGVTVGSLAYMSPEQVRGLPTVDPRSDLYSVGAILYQLAAGRPPFTADNAYSAMQAQVEMQPDPPSQYNPGLSPRLDRLILRSLEKSPPARFQTAEEFSSALSAEMGQSLYKAASAVQSAAQTFRTLPVAIVSIMLASFVVSFIDTALSLPPALPPVATVPPPPLGVLKAAPSKATVEPPRSAPAAKTERRALPERAEPARLAAVHLLRSAEAPDEVEVASEPAEEAPEEPAPPAPPPIAVDVEDAVKPVETIEPQKKKRGSFLRVFGKLIPRKKKQND